MADISLCSIAISLFLPRLSANSWFPLSSWYIKRKEVPHYEKFFLCSRPFWKGWPEKFSRRKVQERFGTWTAVFKFWRVNGVGLIFFSISHSHFQLRKQLVWETLLCQQAQDTLPAQHQLVIKFSTGKDQNHRTFWVKRDSHGWSSPTLNDTYRDQIHDLGVICTMLQAADQLMVLLCKKGGNGELGISFPQGER